MLSLILLLVTLVVFWAVFLYAVIKSRPDQEDL